MHNGESIGGPWPATNDLSVIEERRLRLNRLVGLRNTLYLTGSAFATGVAWESGNRRATLITGALTVGVALKHTVNLLWLGKANRESGAYEARQDIEQQLPIEGLE